MKLNTKDISFVNFNNQPISWIKFNAVKVWEAFKTYILSGTLPLSFSGIGKPLVDYKIYGNSKKKTILPDEYQQVEYVQTTGTQYINTGVALKSGLKMIIDWVYQDAVSGNSYTGGHIGSPGNRWLVGSQRNQRYYFAVGTSNVGTEFTFGNRDVVEAYWANKASYIKVNGVKSTSTNFTSYALGNEPNYTFYLSATNRNGAAASIPRLTIYGCKFYQDDVLVRDYVPCYRKSDNEIGLYDLVNNVFYVNNGTGDFLKGANTPTEIKSLAPEFALNINENPININHGQSLNKFGDYADYIDFKNQKLIKQIAVKTFDGTENWEAHKTNDDNVVYRLDNVLTPLLNAPTSATYMTHFALTDIYSTASFTAGLYRFGFDQDKLTITSSRLYVSSDKMTVAEFKAWLAENKPTIYYPIAPTEETVELPEIPTIKGENILDINTEIKPSNVEITYKGK